MAGPVGVSNGTFYYKNAVDKKAAGSDNLGRDQFLKILVAQLSNQDPTQPLQDKEFIAQMATFTSVEQLTNMAEEMRLLRQSIGFSSSLIGKTIRWQSTDSATEESEYRSGIVESIKVKDGKQYAAVNGENISLANIIEIK